ncbi:MAG TPA: hypothetical protein VGR03_04815 [Candidatus Acidoferrum sp.]|nr:hypothetical protein [Candidatus Acidoferrum sp.]
MFFTGDRKVDLADACLIRLAVQLETADILTLDKDFEIYRGGRNKLFRMLLSLKYFPSMTLQDSQ